MNEETSVQLITLNTGDHIISEARKVYVDKEDQTSIYVELTDPQILSLEKDVGGGHYEIKLTKWNPFSSENKFLITPLSIVAVSEPLVEIIDAYNKTLEKLRTND